ncbi:MAG: aldehyde dehydrogenase family protein [Ilumatobacteraceae bacterium]
MSVINSVVLPSPDASTVSHYGIFVNGEIHAGSGPQIDLVSRIDGSQLGVVLSASPSDVTNAYTSAVEAQSSWRSTTPAKRAEIFQRAAVLFRQRADELGSIISAEMGKPLGEARTEVEKGAAILDYYAQAGYRSSGDFYTTDSGEDVFVFEEPLGTVALITPWNFPFTLPMRKIAASLAVGNTAIFKPATNTSICGLVMGQTLLDAGLPKGVLNVIIGKSQIIEQALLKDPRLGGVSLTGSYETAAHIRSLIPVEVPFQAELGGKNALVVWNDANLDEALEIVKASSFRNNGQICTSCGRLLVHRDVANEFLEKVRASITSSKMETTEGSYGIMSSKGEHEKISDLLGRTVDGYSEVVSASWNEDRLSPTVIVEPKPGELLDEVLKMRFQKPIRHTMD